MIEKSNLSAGGVNGRNAGTERTHGAIQQHLENFQNTNNEKIRDQDCD